MALHMLDWSLLFNYRTGALSLFFNTQIGAICLHSFDFVEPNLDLKLPAGDKCCHRSYSTRIKTLE